MSGYQSSSVRARRVVGAAVLSLGVSSSIVSAAEHAAAVVSYTSGGANAAFQSPSAALGAPDGVTGENAAASNYYGFPNVLSPFSPAYQGDELVQIGEGGQLTLRLGRYVNVVPGKSLGVVSNVSLVDSDFTDNTGTNGPTASTFGGGRAVVRVSPDGANWVSLGEVTFDLPALYYANAGAYDAAGPANPITTDFGKPFEGTLRSFDGKDWAGTVAAFAAIGGGYSGGGTWLDLSGTGLAQVGFVQFLVPDDGNAGTANRFAVDSVSIANGFAGASVPEPAGLGVIVATMALLRRGRRDA
jgi:hypothetical protein